MDNQSEVIHQQMQETRSALQDKLETLEEQVKNTVQGATEAVTDTVETVKDAVQETVGTVKDTVQETVQSVRNTFDLAHHVEAHPWAMFFGATAIGFIASRWLMKSSATASAKQSEISKSQPAADATSHTLSNGRNGVSHSPQAPPESTVPTEDSVAGRYEEEIAKIKSLAVGALGAVVRDMMTSSAPPAVAEQIKEIVDGVTVKMGGHVIEAPILQQHSQYDGTAAADNDDNDNVDSTWPTRAGRV